MKSDEISEIYKAAAVVIGVLAVCAFIKLAVFFFDWRGRQTPAASHVDETAHRIAETADTNARRVDIIFDDLKAKEAQIGEKDSNSTSGDVSDVLGSLLRDYRKQHTGR